MKVIRYGKQNEKFNFLKQKVTCSTWLDLFSGLNGLWQLIRASNSCDFSSLKARKKKPNTVVYACFLFKWCFKKLSKKSSHYPSKGLVTVEEFSPGSFLFMLLWFPTMLWSPNSCVFDTVGKWVRIIQIILQMVVISK